jgi:hypothetical protein
MSTAGVPAGGGFGTTRIETLADGIFAAVFYNTRLTLCLYFLLPVVHLLPGRVDMTETSEDAGGR